MGGLVAWSGVFFPRFAPPRGCRGGDFSTSLLVFGCFLSHLRFPIAFLKQIENELFFLFSTQSIMVLCFSFLFFLRKYSFNYDELLSRSALIFLFTTYAPLMIVLGVDVFCELLKGPITNVPMILVLLLAAILNSIAGVLLVVNRFLYSDSNAFRTLHVISLMSAASWVSAVIFIIDAIIVLRFV